MKLSFAVLLLVPVAFAYNALPTSRILIDGEYFLTESMHARGLHFIYLRDSLSILTMQNNPRLLREMIDIEGPLNRPLAIDTYAYTRDYKFNCYTEAKDLRSLIKNCSGNIHLRIMTADEKDTMHKYKKDQEGKLLKRLIEL